MSLNAISSANCKSNACSPDVICFRFIRDCIPVVFPVLVNIFDTSLQSGIFPLSWKRAL